MFSPASVRHHRNLSHFILYYIVVYRCFSFTENWCWFLCDSRKTDSVSLEPLFRIIVICFIVNVVRTDRFLLHMAQYCYLNWGTKIRSHYRGQQVQKPNPRPCNGFSSCYGALAIVVIIIIIIIIVYYSIIIIVFITLPSAMNKLRAAGLNNWVDIDIDQSHLRFFTMCWLNARQQPYNNNDHNCRACM